MTRLKSIALTMPILLGISACAQKPADDPTSGNITESSQEERTAPDIGVTAAPGVAFRYDYRFGLEAQKIAGLQERHAAACEALGIEKCRITGLSFLRRGTEAAQATLDLALAPELARKFGRDAIAAVEAAKGNVAAIEIGGVDQNPALESSARDAAVATSDRAALEAELARHRSPDQVRADLLRRIQAQKEAERAARSATEAIRGTLATTPIHFSYSTEGFLPGFSIERTTAAALGFAGMILNALLALLVALGALTVPIGLVLLGLAHGRRTALLLWRRLAPEPQPDLG